MTTRLVTGFVPLPDHPRDEAAYHALGAQLCAVRWPKIVFYDPLSSCWLSQYLRITGDLVLSSKGDNPAKNTEGYHIVQHQKFAWIAKAAEAYPEDDLFVWVDYGIFHLPSVTKDVVEGMLARARPGTAIELPGCWGASRGDVSDEYPCWRFCGGLMVVPRHLARLLFDIVKMDVCEHMLRTKRLSWEVNTLARVEQMAPTLFHWYKADHNATMFTEY